MSVPAPSPRSVRQESAGLFPGGSCCSRGSPCTSPALQGQRSSRCLGGRRFHPNLVSVFLFACLFIALSPSLSPVRYKCRCALQSPALPSTAYCNGGESRRLPPAGSSGRPGGLTRSARAAPLPGDGPATRRSLDEAGGGGHHTPSGTEGLDQLVDRLVSPLKPF